METKKQTAVEWLVEQVNSDCTNSTFIAPHLIAEAKKMEREQILNAYAEGFSNGNRINFRNRNKYYNDTYVK